MLEDEPDGATLLDPDEAGELIPGHLFTRGDLNAWEQHNIVEAVLWSRSSRQPPLDELFVRELHRRMFDRTWKWAGKYRRSDKNLGVSWPRVQTEVRLVIDDGRYWLANSTYSIDEAALRLHHRMVQAHPFPNGNGRHARLWCDTILRTQKRPPFRWKSRKLNQEGAARRAYIGALRAADHGDLAPLCELILRGRP